MASEKISVTLEADADQLTREFTRARMAAESFSGKTLPMVERNLGQAHRAGQQLQTGLKQLNASSKLSGGGMLQLAQFADDAQYGLRGIMNNIPGLIMGLGGGAGVAGALSLAVLAGSKLLPLLREMNGVVDPKAFDDYAASVREVAAKTEELAKSRGVAFAKAFVDSITQEESAIRLQNVALAENVSLMQTRARLAGAVAAAQDALAKAKIQADPKLNADQKRTALARLDEQAAARQAKEQLAAIKQQEQAARESMKNKIDEQRRGFEDISAIQRRIAEKEQQMEPLTAAKSAAELAAASLPGARKNLEDLGKLPLSSLFSFGVNEEAERAEAVKKAREELAALESRAIMNPDVARQAGEVGGELEKLREELAKAQEKQAGLTTSAKEALIARDGELKRLEAQAAALQKIIALEKEKRQVEQGGGNADAVKSKMAELQGIIAGATVKTLPAAEKKSGKAAGASAAGAGMVDELVGQALTVARSKIVRAGSAQSRIGWAGRGSGIGWGDGEIPASLRGGVGIGRRPGLRGARPGLGPAAAEAERRRESTVPNSPISSLLKEVQGLREDVQSVGKHVGLF